MAKSNLQYFQNDWNKTVNWAAQNKIPKTAWYPVYQLDLQRYANGQYPMSQAERARAILSASNLSANTILPTDNPSPTNIFSNTLTDLRNIFTGLEPTKLFQNIYDEFKNTLEHPEWLANPEKNTLMQWLPGWADIGEYKSGGIDRVLAHPIVSFLDVLPLASPVTRLGARTATGAAVADRLGMTADQLAATPPIRLAGKAISAIPGHLPFREAAKGLGTPAELAGSIEQGGAALRNLTVGDRWKTYAQAKGLSKAQADLMAGALKENHDQTLIHIQIAKPFYNIVSKLTSNEQRLLHDLLQKSGRTYPELLQDDAIPVDVRQAIKAYEPIETWFNEVVLSSERFADVRMPDGTTEKYANTPNNPVIKARAKADRAIEQAAKSAAVSDGIAAEIKQADAEAAPMTQQLQTMQQQIYALTKTNAWSAGTTGVERFLDPVSVGRLFGIDGEANAFQIRALQEIIAPGGLIDQLEQTVKSGDFKAYRSVALKLVRRFQNKTFAQIGPELAAVRQLANDLYSYAKFRAKKEDQFTTAFHGRADRKFAGSTATLQKAATKAMTEFEKTVFTHFPSRFRPAFLDAYVANLVRHDKGSQILDEAANVLIKKGAPRSEVMAIRSDPRVLYELINLFSKSSSVDIMAGIMDRDTEAEIANAAFAEVARLRAQGFVPHYIPNVRSTELGEMASYNVFIRTSQIPQVDAAFERLMDFTNSVYDVMGAVNKGIKQVLSRDGTIEYLDDYVKQFLYPIADLNAVYAREYPMAFGADVGSRTAHFEHIMQNEWGLKKFDPESIFGVTSARIAKDAFYIPADLAKTLDQIVNREQNLDNTTFGKGTQIFRMAVLGYSPRFIAHIVFGGSFLVALRVSPFAFRFMGDAYRMVKEGSSEVLRQHSTQTGADPVELQIASVMKQSGPRQVAGAEKNFHWWGGVKMRNMLLKEQMAKLNLDSSQIGSWLKVLPALTFKFTNFATNMQRAVVYLDGAAHAERRGWVLDEAGNRVKVSPERAHEEGMRAAERVLGDLRQMTPLERHVFTKIMPFYGWTKHILRYVSSYPSDHPYRAMFLSNLANMNSEDVPSALPTRIQLLFFLGSPSPDGSVNALDVRALNPLRDTANYATIGGFLSSLNPALTALPAMVDPSIVFGDNVLYPNLQYNQLYGIKEAAPGGNLLTAAEQYVPQITALDAALGLSSQYRNLRKSDPAGFAKTIFESLGLPFTLSQVNVKQLAAKNEIDRYQQAQQAALNAWQSGDFGPIAGYPTVPDPLQPDYNITPMALEALYRNALAATGQPPSEVVPSIPAPNI